MKRFLSLIAMLGISFSAIAGDVTGKVAFDGKAPAAARLRMDADKVCARAHKAPVSGEDVVVNKNGTLKNVLIYVKDGLGGKKFNVPTSKMVFDQEGCIYKPHVMGIMVGQELEVLN
ncbi:MAG TPA: hypothetical protein VGB10_00755, partial [Bacteroidota bacterium]